MVRKEVIVYQTESGREPFNEWLDSLKDAKTVARIISRLERVELGNYGDAKSVGEGVKELRYTFGAGYRVYFAKVENTVLLLLCGGDKSSQRRDVKTAQSYWQDYRRRQETERR